MTWTSGRTSSLTNKVLELVSKLVVHSSIILSFHSTPRLHSSVPFPLVFNHGTCALSFILIILSFHSTPRLHSSVPFALVFSHGTCALSSFNNTFMPLYSTASLLCPLPVGVHGTCALSFILIILSFHSTPRLHSSVPFPLVFNHGTCALSSFNNTFIPLYSTASLLCPLPVGVHGTCALSFILIILSFHSTPRLHSSVPFPLVFNHGTCALSFILIILSFHSTPRLHSSVPFPLVFIMAHVLCLSS